MMRLKQTSCFGCAVWLTIAVPVAAQQSFTILPTDAPAESAAYDACLKETAEAYDDRVSDAQTVAKVVADECRYREVLFVESLLRNRNDLKRAAVYQAAQGKREMDSLKAVLRGRR